MNAYNGYAYLIIATVPGESETSSKHSYVVRHLDLD